MKLRVTIICCALHFSPAAFAQESCPSLSDTAGALRAAVAEARLDETADLSVRALSSLRCQSQPMQPLLIGQVFQVIGAAAYFNGDMATASETFSWAASTSPGSDLDPMYGQPAVDFYNKLRDSVIANGGATIALLGEGSAWIDGRSLKIGIARDVTAGSHLLQTLEPEGIMNTQEITLGVGEEKVVTIGPVAPTPAATPAKTSKPMSASTNSSTKLIMLSTGGALVATGAILMVLANSAHQDFNESTDASALKGLQAKTNTLGWAGVGTGLAGAGLLGSGVFLVGDTGAGIGFRGRW